MQNNPTNNINLSFPDYVSERTLKEAKHLKGGIPDYAYATDFSLRQKIRKIPGVYAFFKAAMSTWLAEERQLVNMNYARVTNKQFPRIYEMIHHCAKTLGIGVPTVYVVPGLADSNGSRSYTMNACAYAFEDSDPMIEVTTAAVERLTEEELLVVLGHECGHIQNNHSIYSYAVNMFVSVGGATLGESIQQLISLPVSVALLSWSRAAEVTADRAGCICGGKLNAALSQQAKFLSGGVMGNYDYDIDEILKQYDEMGSIARFQELLGRDHPIGLRRMLAMQEFFNSEVYYDWHPEQREAGKNYYSKEELDTRCDKFLSTLKKGDR